MAGRSPRGVTFANVCSLLALTIALGTGTAYAANTIRSKDIVNGQVKTADIGAGQVTTPDIKAAAVGGPQLAPDAVDGSKVLNRTLSSVDLAVGSVQSPEIADGGVTGADLVDNAVSSDKVADDALTSADIAGADVNGGGISVPTGYVPNGRCRQLDAAVGGAKAGEAVVFSIQAALQDGVVLYGQRVSSDGHVMFDVCNFSGTTQAAISDLPVRIITFG
jgi:hypothetical protein